VAKPKADRQPKPRFLSEAEEKRLRASLARRDSEAKAARDRANAWRRERKKPELPALPHYADHLTPAILLSTNTGLRRGELLALRWADVDLAGRQLTVRASGTKSGQTRHVPLNTEALTVLKRWRRQSNGPRVFAVDTSFKTAWASLLKQAKIESFRWHDLRHHFGSRLVQSGVPLNTVRELLGHQSIAMTLRYAHLADGDKASAVEKLVRP
jgi:integrase